MGRSANSRNRVFKQDEESGRLYTEAADPAKVKDPSLIIYNAMRERRPHYIVSNGSQTDVVVGELGGAPYIDVALARQPYEPDEPNFTQRITALSSLSKGVGYIQMSILRKSPFGRSCDRLTYYYKNPPARLGFCITTYSGDGNPLPPFTGEPLLMPLVGGIGEVAETYWGGLNEENRVALAVKFIELGSGYSNIYIINKY